MDKPNKRSWYQEFIFRLEAAISLSFEIAKIMGIISILGVVIVIAYGEPIQNIIWLITTVVGIIMITTIVVTLINLLGYWLQDIIYAKKEGQNGSVTFNQEEIFCPDPKGKEQKILWDEIDHVIIETTDNGPYSEDLYWVFLKEAPEQKVVIIPNGMNDFPKLLTAMHERLPAFDNTAVVTAMGSTENNTIKIWSKQQSDV